MERHRRGRERRHGDRGRQPLFPPQRRGGGVPRPTDTHSTCPWKGLASYYSVVVDGQHNDDAAWYYPEPKAEAENIRDRVAFWRGIEVAPA